MSSSVREGGSLRWAYKETEKAVIDVVNEWKSLASFLGKDVIIRRVKDTFSAKAIDVDEEGALLIKDKNGQLQRIFFDDVILQV